MFNEKLKNLREHQELSQAEVSARLGMPKSTYSRYETGASEPNLKTLKALANFYDVSIDYLLENNNIISDREDVVDFNQFVMSGRYTINSKFPTKSDRRIINNMVKAVFNEREREKEMER